MSRRLRVMTVNDEVYPKMTPESAIDLLESLRAKEGGSHAEA